MVTVKKGAREVADKCERLRGYARTFGPIPSNRTERLDEADALIDVLYCQCGGSIGRAKEEIFLLIHWRGIHSMLFAEAWQRMQGLSRENIHDNVETALRAQARRRAS